MPILKNTRHEKFAQNLAKGKTSDESYSDAGFKPNRGNAIRIKANESIATRVLELQSAGGERILVTIVSLTLELEEAHFMFLKTIKATSAAVFAVMGKAKLRGLLIDKGELTGKDGGPTKMASLRVTAFIRLSKDKFSISAPCRSNDALLIFRS